MTDTQSDNTHQDATHTSARGAVGATLTCQWCSKQLPPGETVCPICGSSGVPDESLTVPGINHPDDLSKLEVSELSAEQINEVMQEESESLYRNSAADEPDPAVTLLAVAGAVVISVIMGVIAAPLLATPMENTLGVVIDDPSDLRPLGGVIGMLVGMFLGAIAMWVAAPRK